MQKKLKEREVFVMKTSIETPPVTLIARTFSSSKLEKALHFPVSTVIILPEESVNTELAEAFKKLDERIKTLLFSAKEKKNERRVSELKYYEHNLELLKNIGELNVTANHKELANVQKGFHRLYERARLELGQFLVEGNTRKYVEIAYVLDELKNIQKRAIKYGIAL